MSILNKARWSTQNIFIKLDSLFCVEKRLCISQIKAYGVMWYRELVLNGLTIYHHKKIDTQKNMKVC